MVWESVSCNVCYRMSTNWSTFGLVPTLKPEVYPFHIDFEHRTPIVQLAISSYSGAYQGSRSGLRIAFAHQYRGGMVSVAPS